MADKITTILDMDLTSGVTATSTGPSAPGAPGTLSLTAGSPAYTVIALSWSVPSNTGNSPITGYRIKKDGAIIVADTSSTGTTYSATGLTNNTSYNFTVAAINAYGTSPDGNTPSATTGAYTVPGAPTSLTATAAASSTINLSWTAPAVTGGQSITGYKIEISTNSGGSWSTEVADTSSTGTTYSDTSLTAATRYDYRVAAINSVGAGASSNEAYATTTNPFAAWGGIITQYTDSGTTYRVHCFRGSGTFEVSTGEADVDWLIVAGGGGAGTGGAGAGGVLGSLAGASGATTASGAYSVSAGTYTIVVGLGGHNGYTSDASATNGGDSTAFGYTAVGGGRNAGGAGFTGGSGGGGYPGSANGAGTSGQGYAGQHGSGTSGGGGGGNGEAGGTDSTGQGGDGALHWGITATAVGYAGGGGAGDYNSSVKKVGGAYGGGDGATPSAADAGSGWPNTGGGGGGRDVTPVNYPHALATGWGGAGICLIRYEVDV